MAPGGGIVSISNQAQTKQNVHTHTIVLMMNGKRHELPEQSRERNMIVSKGDRDGGRRTNRQDSSMDGIQGLVGLEPNQQASEFAVPQLTASGEERRGTTASSS